MVPCLGNSKLAVWHAVRTLSGHTSRVGHTKTSLAATDRSRVHRPTPAITSKAHGETLGGLVRYMASYHCSGVVADQDLRCETVALSRLSVLAGLTSP